MALTKEKLTELGLYSNENLLINGGFKLWQRGNVTLTADDANWKYTADRWRAKSAYASVVSNTGGLKVSYATNVQYVMETDDYNAIAGRAVTLSYSKNGTVYVSTFTASSAVVVNLNLLANDVLGWAKLEVGSISTPLAPRLYAEELALCQRYYRPLPTNRFVYSVSAGTTYYFVGCLMFSVPMRTDPTVTLTASTVVNIGTPSSYGITTKSADGISYIYAVLATPPSAGYWQSITGTADAEIY